MTKARIAIAIFAVVGAVLGAVLGALVATQPSRFTESANVALLPPPDATTMEASSFWEVLTRGQVTRTAAIIYDDTRWLESAANAANVPQDDLTLAAAALPDTTILSVTVTASSAAAAEAALNDVLTTATPQVSSLSAPYLVKVLWPATGGAVPIPSRTQVAAAGALGGLVVGGGIAWFVTRRRKTQTVLDDHDGHAVDKAPTGS